MEEFLKSLGIDGNFTTSDDGCLTLDIEDSDTYYKYFSKLDKSDEVEQDEDATLISLETMSVQFVNDKYTITMLADLDSDAYKLTCREN